MTTTTTSAQPRSPSLDRRAAMRLAATEYDRVVALLRQLSAQDWHQPTDNTGWDVRALAGHMLGMAEMAASPVEMLRQEKAARQLGGGIDALTAVQVEGRSSLTTEQLVVPIGRCSSLQPTTAC